MARPEVHMYEHFYRVTGGSVEAVVECADKSNMIDFETVSSIDIVKESNNEFTMVCLRRIKDG